MSSESEPPSGGIEVAAIDVRYEGRSGDRVVDALRDVTLSIPAGSFVSLVGPSGSGKSTLLRVMAGLAQADRGVVRIDGTPVTGPRLDVGIMFQTPQLFLWRTALENVLLPVDVRGWDRRAHVERATGILRSVGLEGSENAYPRELSGGMQQRVALSRTLMADPAVLLMDEPFGALDEFTRERLDLELLAIWERDRKTVVFVTHNIGEAVLLSDRVVGLGTNPGRVLETIDVDLPRPRTIELTRDPHYLALVFRIRELLAPTHG